MRQFFLAMSAALMVAGCSETWTTFPVDPSNVDDETETLGAAITVVQLTAETISSFGGGVPRKPGGPSTLPGNGGWTYLVGRGDILEVIVWGHPDLTVPTGSDSNTKQIGHRVQGDGSFFYPFVGKVEAAGLTPEAIRANLTEKMAQFINEPQIEVKLVGYNSQAVSVTGEVARPSRQPLTEQPLTLLDAINAAGGLNDAADAARVTVKRLGRIYVVDLESFLQKGISKNNPILKPGDVVNIPRIERQEAYILGQIVKPSTIDISTDSVTLTQALSRAGGLREGDADARGVFVFRDAGERAITVYQLDATNPVAFVLGTRFYLQPQDVVYITTAPVSRWNQIIASALPSVNAVLLSRNVNN